MYFQASANEKHEKLKNMKIRLNMVAMRWTPLSCTRCSVTVLSNIWPYCGFTWSREATVGSGEVICHIFCCRSDFYWNQAEPQAADQEQREVRGPQFVRCEV